jgi:hypothetical protein
MDELRAKGPVHLFPVEGNLRVVGAWVDDTQPDTARDFFGAIDLKGPSSYTKILKETGSEHGSPNLDWVDGHPIVSWIPKGTDNRLGDDHIWFFDFKEEKAFPALEMHVMPGLMRPSGLPAVYSVNGELRAAVPEDDEGHLAIADVKEHKILHRLPVTLWKEQARVRKIDMGGEPHLLIARADEILDVNLVTETIETIPAPGNFSKVVDFEYQGTRYLMWGNDDGSVQIYDLTSRGAVITFPAQNAKVTQVVAFEKDGMPMAMVTGWSKPPRVFQLMSKVKP